jgi:hypothetical protein
VVVNLDDYESASNPDDDDVAEIAGLVEQEPTDG